jgi:hypothetical protein
VIDRKIVDTVKVPNSLLTSAQGLWKPETKMGTIADHFQLQQEQLNVFKEFLDLSQQNQIYVRSEPGSKLLTAEQENLAPRCSIWPECMFSRNLTALHVCSAIKEILLPKITAENVLDCVAIYMKAYAKGRFFDHATYSANFYNQRDTGALRTDANRSADATRAYQDLCTSLRLIGLLPQMKKEHIKKYGANASEERKVVEQQNEGQCFLFTSISERLTSTHVYR